MSDSPPAKRPRPLSPHLQIYQPQLTSITSILHRVSGVGLTIALGLITYALYAAANDPAPLAKMTAFFASPFGLVILTGFVASMAYHFCAGIRHLIFDTGAMMELKQAYAAGYAVLIGAAILTVVVMSAICCTLHQQGLLNV